MDTPDGLTGNLLADLALGLRNWALSQWEVTLFLALFAVFRWWVSASYKETDSRQGLVTFLRHAHAANTYKLLIGWLLDRADRWFLTPDQRAQRRERRPAWSVKLYDRCLAFAFVYPVLSLFVFWGSTNSHAMLGDMVALTGNADRDWQVATMGFLAISLLTIWYGARSANIIARSSALIAAIAAGLAVTLTYPQSVDGIYVGAAETYSSANAFAVTFLLTFAATVMGGGAAACVVGATCAIVFTLRIKSALFNDFAQIFLVDALPPGSGSWTVSYFVYHLLIAAAVVLPMVIGVRWVMRQGGDGTASYALLSALALGAILLARGAEWSQLYFLLFLLALPLVNAVFDFVSIGLTRWALRRGMRRLGVRTLLYSGLDLAAAATLFIGLGCVSIAVAHLLNVLDDFPFLRLSGGNPITAEQCSSHRADPNVFHALRTCPDNHWWLYATFFSTLIPTVVHGMVAVWAIGPAVLGGRSRHWLARTIETSDRHFGRRWVALSIVSAWSAFAVAAPVVVLFWTGGWIASEHPDWGLALVDFFEAFYIMLPDA